MWPERPGSLRARRPHHGLPRRGRPTDRVQRRLRAPRPHARVRPPHTRPRLNLGLRAPAGGLSPPLSTNPSTGLETPPFGGRRNPGRQAFTWRGGLPRGLRSQGRQWLGAVGALQVPFGRKSVPRERGARRAGITVVGVRVRGRWGRRRVGLVFGDAGQEQEGEESPRRERVLRPPLHCVHAGFPQHELLVG